MKRKPKLQFNPGPLKVTKGSLRCIKCRQWAPRCSCWDGPDYREAKP